MRESKGSETNPGVPEPGKSTPGEPEPATDTPTVGLYEIVFDSHIRERFADVRDRVELRAVDQVDVPAVLSQHVADRLSTALQALDASDQLKLASQMLHTIDASTLELTDAHQAQKLLELKADAGSASLRRPNTPLTDAVLLTNAAQEPSINSELASEFFSADAVDVIMAFVKWTGLHTLLQPLQLLRDRGVPLRIVTSTYLGVTERKALDRLVQDFGAQVRVAYDGRSTRLHAKSWLIRRNTGFHTAFVGSSNLSRSAMLDGVEWNVRLAHTSTPAVFAKFQATFESYWNSPAFEEYVPDRDAARLDRALEEAAGHTPGGGRSPAALVSAGVDYSPLEVRPYPYQRRMLDDLALSRRHGHHENLVVAATGTGKTVVSALDWKRVSEQLAVELGRTPRTLFVAHRNEILQQARATFTEVIKRDNFGVLGTDSGPIARATLDLLASRGNTLFATIQSLHAHALEAIPPDFFDIVIIDEFHHAEAASYRRLLDHLQWRELVGLTATPERGDGVNVAHEFFGGRIATELRLWEALDEDLLVPFHYFMNNDGTDLSQVTVRAGEYDSAELSRLFTANDARFRLILRSLENRVLDPGTMRALCFCVDIAHAEYMAAKFTEAGLHAVAITSRNTDPQTRQGALDALARGELQIICAVDIFNEGVDIPSVDTLLMLRPTSSPTVFLQQLGRGLRRAPGKAVLTVLDFVGNQARDFAIHRKFRVLSGKSGRALEKAVEQGFPSLPSGCQIVLDEYSQDAVLRSVRDKIRVRFKDVVQDVRISAEQRGVSPVDYMLEQYLEDSMHDLPDLYARDKAGGRGVKAPWSWWRITQLAATGQEPPGQWDGVRVRLRNLARVNDAERAAQYVELLMSSEPVVPDDVRRSRYAHMLAYSFFPTGKYDGKNIGDVNEALQILRSVPGLAEELRQIFAVRLARDEALVANPKWADDKLSSVPLFVGADYSREELLAAIDVGKNFSGQKPGSMREGVHYSKELNLDALLVTLVKSEADFSPHTMYRDYAMSADSFHWESQATTPADSPTGRRYSSGSSNVALFIRTHKTDEFGGGAAYTFAGPATLKFVQGSKPMQVVWDLHHELPPDLYLSARAVAGA
ncbi:DUF3427 domain-containing protein [Trueperella bialowiezensis]|uniref:Type I restriction enzyme EcoKI subunit R n=1 Tax=Trueperella bialowiezensis TaxID=312285 RepID=A0A3S4VTQ6_9ACTO|nr:DUF3427 domain-containing protein [Trueperella bialowiezensis]VEI13521.1 type I restriction enzyme EcoKI subunit R [Trueperella bialowiezensis]